MADKKVFILESTLTNIGNSIRNKKGTTAKINPLDIPDEIDSIRSINDMVLQTKTVEPDVIDTTVVPDSGYDGLSQVRVKSMPVVVQATPSVSINSEGLITASSTQTEGYVKSGTKSGVKQLTVQATKTVTPMTVSQTAVASGVYTTGTITVGAIPSSYVKPSRTYSAKTYTPGTTNQTIASGTYCSGTQTIKGDSNLKAENIKSGISIFNIVGSYEGSGGSSGGSGDSGDYEIGIFTVAGLSTGYSMDYEFPFIIGMTWRDYIESKMNVLRPYPGAGLLNFGVDSSGSPCHMSMAGVTFSVSLDGTSGVSLDDEIINNYEYTSYYGASPW